VEGYLQGARGRREGVFVSYARRDGEAQARKLALALRKEGLTVWLDRLDMSGGSSWRIQLAEAIRNSRFLVLILTQGALTSEVAEWEWRVARREGVSVLPVKGTPELDFAAIPRWMRELHWYSLDQEWENFRAVVNGPGLAERVPFMAINLPRGYVRRHREFGAVKDLLLADGGSGDPVQVAVHGPAGFGKSTLALSLCHDEDVTTRFHDGILWVSLGRHPDVFRELEFVHRALTGVNTGAIDVREAARGIGQRLARRRCLLVVDDVWRTSDLDAFLLLRTAMLVTTRQFDVARAAAGPECRVLVDKMAPEEAVRVLTADLGPVTSGDQYLELSRRLGEWALLLNLARGALQTQVARGASPDRALATVNQAIDRRQAIAFDAAYPGSRNDAAVDSLSLSLEMISDADTSRWADLAVFPEDTAIPLRTLAQLWGTDEFEAEETSGRLADSSLLLLDLATGTIQVHDVLLEAAQRRADDMTTLHQRLIAAWGDPRSLSDDDTYAWTWVTHHLIAVGQAGRLRTPLLDPEWLRRRLRATNVDTLLADFDLQPEDEVLRAVRDALHMSARIIAGDDAELPGQLRGRLLATGLPELQHFLDLAGQSPSPCLVPLRASLDPPTSARSRPADRHPVAVTGLVAADRGRLVASGSDDGTIKVWDPASGALLRTIKDDQHRHSRGYPLMAGFADRPQALSASGGMLNLWDLDTGALVGTIGEPGGPSIYALAVTEQNGRQAIFAQDEELRIWDVEAGSQRTFGTAPWPTPILLAVAADGLVVCGSARMGGMDDKSLNTFEEIIEFNALQVWDLRTGRMLRTLEGNPCGINALVTTPDGHHVISGTNFGLYVFQDDSLRMWDVRSGKLERSFKGHSRTGALAVTPDQQILVSGGAFLFGRVGFDFSLKIQALKTGELIAAIPKHTGPVVGLATTRDSHWAVSAAGAWDDMAQKPRRSFREGSGEDATVRVWDLEKGTLIATFHGEDAGTCLILANDQTIVAGSRNGAVHFLRFNR
jgi:WD40 repeat protein